MSSRDTALQLLQVVALTLPAFAIYFDIIKPDDVAGWGVNDAEATEIHSLRLSFLFLVAAGAILIAEILFTPNGMEYLLNGFSLVLIFFALVFFAIAIAFGKTGIKAGRTITWPLRTVWHRIKSKILD